MADDVRAGQELMFDLVGQLPRHLVESRELAGLADVSPGDAPHRRLVLCGMGGSAIAGDLARPLLAETLLWVHRDYDLPRWVTPDDLVVLSSYSGDTEETLSAWHEAGRRGCVRLVQTAGGELGRLAAAAGAPVVNLPAGLPPRASLGYGLGALLRICQHLGILPDADAQLAGAAAELAPRAVLLVDPDGAGETHPAQVASRLVDRLPVVHTAGEEAHAAGRRLRAQFNENAKVPALGGAYPELDHNELVGWGDTGGCPDRALLVLNSGSGSPALARRVAVTRGLLADAFASITEVVAEGASPLARILHLVLWGDALSCHLAVRRGVDPVPVEAIESLKRALSEPADT